MSSIISDIFYGSKQNILDQYLLRQDENSQSITPQQTYNKISNYLHESSNFINLQNLYEINLDIQNLLEKHMYQVYVQLGKKQIKQYIEIKKKQKLSKRIILKNCYQKFIKEHKNIKIEIQESINHRKFKSFGYIPIQAIFDCIKSQKNIEINIPLKGNLSIEKIKIKIEVIKKYQQSFISNQYNPIKSNVKIQQYYIDSSQDISKPQAAGTSKNEYSDDKDQEFTIKSSARFMVCKVNQKINRNDQNYRIKIGDNNQFKKLKDQIKIWNFKKQGILLELVYMISQQIKDTIGYVHLNSLVLLNPYIQGQFPIVQAFPGERYLGKIQLQPIIKNEKAPILMESIPKNIKPSSLKQQVRKSSSSYPNILLILNLKKILLYKSNRKQINLKNKSNRIILKCSNDIKIQQISISNITKYIYEIKPKNNVISLFLERYQSDSIKIQIQIYQMDILISYSQLIIYLNSQEPLFYLNGYLDGGNSNKQESEYNICQIYNSLWILQYQQEYFLKDRLSNIIQTLTMQNIIRNVKTSWNSENIAEYLVKQLNYAFTNKVTYIQCQRLGNLLKDKQKILKRLHVQLIQNNPISNCQILEELKYIDPNWFGIISLNEWKQLEKYYKLNHSSHWEINLDKDWQDLVLKSKLNILNEKNQNFFIPYLFFVVGFSIINAGQHQKQESRSLLQNFEYIQKNKEVELISQDLISQKVYFLKEISCKNIHNLLPLKKIPSCYISCKPAKIHYSNANPIFILNKQIRHGDTLTIYHKDIKSSQDTILCTLTMDGTNRVIKIGDADITICYSSIH